MAEVMSTQEGHAVDTRRSPDASAAPKDGAQADQKSARPKNPKPTVGYIVVRPGWDPRNRQDSIDLWIQHPNLRDVQASLDFADIVKSSRTVVVKVTTTFEIVEGGRG